MSNIDNIVSKLDHGNNLSVEESSYVSNQMFNGLMSDDQIIKVLEFINKNGVSINEIIGFATSMRKISKKVSLNFKVIDSCGTGGDGLGTFNISTCSSFIAAACGVKIAKHGNKAITSSSGSADLLHDAGAKIDLNPEQVRKCIEELNFGFMFAPMHHQAMKNVANARKAISPNKTIFNLLGPITNPAGADIQLIGVYNVHSMKLLAQALLKLGTRRAILVNSKDGLDEASIYDLTYVTEIKDNKIAEYTINPDDYHLKGKELKNIITDSHKSSLDMTLAVFNNEDSDALKIAVLNASLLVMLYKDCDTINDAITECMEALSNYSVRDKFNQYIDFTNQV